LIYQQQDQRCIGAIQQALSLAQLEDRKNQNVIQAQSTTETEVAVWVAFFNSIKQSREFAE